MKRTHAVALIAAKSALGATLALGFLTSPSVAHAQPGDLTYCPSDGVWSTEWHQCPPIGDDNNDGRIDEDESGWDCTRMGNKVCGRTSLAGGVNAYDQGAYVGGWN